MSPGRKAGAFFASAIRVVPKRISLLCNTMKPSEASDLVSATAILRLPEVLRITNLSRTTIWRWIKQGEFPAPMQLGGNTSRSIGWRRHDIDDWIATRPTPSYAEAA